MKKFLLNDCKVSNNDYEAIYTISKRINNHKHNSQRLLNTDDVVYFMRAIYNFIVPYITYKLNYTPEFSSNYFYMIYGETEKEIRDLISQRNKFKRSLLNENESKALLEEDLKHLKNLTSEKELKNKNLQEQKDILQKEVSKLKDIKLTTLEGKVARIVDILDKQTMLLENMNKNLQHGANTNFGGKRMVQRG